jgi:2',3'-cyclic-nucleotide 2'-phosphodiesterase (5'-nucleotidase family)
MMLRKLFFAVLIVTTLPSSCSFNKAPTHLFSEPDWEYSKQIKNTKRVVIASTHNFEGALFEEHVKFPVTNGRVNYKLRVGGVSTLKTYIDILKYRYNKDLVLLDTGHLFNLDDNVKDLNHYQEHHKILKVYEQMGYDAINLTDVDYRALKIINPKSHRIPFITSNIINLEKNKPVSDYGVAPYKIINKNGVKIGIIALTSFEKLLPRTTQNFRGIYFEDPILSFLKTKKILKKKGAQIFLLMSSVKSIQELKSLVKRLPPNSVNAIISGNTYSTETEIAGIPLMQNSGKGQYISRLEFRVDMADHVVLKDHTKTLDVTKVCQNFFKSTMDCHTHHVKELSRERVKIIAQSDYEVIPAMFLGHQIKKNNKVETLINK